MLEILIDKNQQERQIALVDNEKLVEYYIDEEKSTRKEGNIYIGVVRNIIKGMQSAFVDIGTEKNSFIHLKDILEKVNEKNEQNKELHLSTAVGCVQRSEFLDNVDIRMLYQEADRRMYVHKQKMKEKNPELYRR